MFSGYDYWFYNLCFIEIIIKKNLLVFTSL